MREYWNITEYKYSLKWSTFISVNEKRDFKDRRTAGCLKMWSCKHEQV